MLVVFDGLGAYQEEVKRTSRARADLSLEYDMSTSLAYASEEEWRRQEESFLSRVRREGRVAERADAPSEE